jgi:UDP-N-acetylglucosamine--N-acetylmuramyl-(pentapeptide) pyrophosphoryl-undecaprenol N-acetylglucosamine transferase
MTAASDLIADARAMRRVVLVTGGTAGHVYPALAIAEAYKQAVASIEVLFFGTGDGFEAQLIPRYSYPLRVVRSRPIVGESLLGKVRTVWGLAGAFMRARQMLIEAKPELVVGFGGYASVPTILAARSLGILTAIHECNVVPGLANKMLGRFVDRIYLGFEAATGQFQTDRVLVTGNPVRTDVGALASRPHDPSSSERPFRILVTGGSQGSPFLNRHVPALLARLAADGASLEVLHQSGQADCGSVREVYRDNGLKASVTPFVDDMAQAYQWADFAISCSGAATLAELAIAGLPVLLVPLSTASKNHQVSNAAAFAQITGNCWLSEDRWDPDASREKITLLFGNQASWRDASERVRRFAKPDASQMMVADCEAIIEARRSEAPRLRQG